MTSKDGTAAQWLTVAQAARALGVSPRTIRRRCQNDELDARQVDGTKGPKWLISNAAIIAAKDADNAANMADTNADTPPTLAALDAPPNARNNADNAAKDAANVADMNAANADLMAALIAEKDARIRDLQKQLDAANGTIEREQIAHAETRRALAFAMSAPILKPAPDLAPPSPTVAPMPDVSPRRRPRPLWQILIGYRPKD